MSLKYTYVCHIIINYALLSLAISTYNINANVKSSRKSRKNSWKLFNLPILVTHGHTFSQ